MVKKIDIAIVGIGIRLPGDIYGPDSLWQALKEGRDCITEVPNDRWSIEKYYDPDPNKIGKIRTKKGGFIKGLKEFDADFFNIYPRVAHNLDPRQRHILEVTYEAIEDAGLILDKISGSQTAVIIGCFLNDESKKISGSDLSSVSSHAVMGIVDTSISARIAFQFNLKGPTLSVDTACSSSLVAIQLACNSIWMGDANMAIAGGVSIMSGHEHTLQIDKGNFLSPDGYCKSFDVSANGYVRSEGAGAVVLKTLKDAKKDGDNIYAVIKNSVVNSDGYTPDGMTVPCEVSQLEMLKKAYSEARINPAEVDFIEAHGTGTPVGDPKECWAFGNIFSKGRSKDNPLIIGSIKSNLGHTEAVAGIAGLAKLALCIKNKQIPQNLHFKNPNPAIKFDEWKLKVASKLIKWPKKSDGKLIAGVNSFGAGGTNAHIVLEEYIDDIKEEIISQESYDFPYLFVISAKRKEALKDLAQKYINFLSKTKHSLADICYSTLTRRSLLDKKLVIIVNSKDELASSLANYLKDNNDKNIVANDEKPNSRKKIAFIFSGQGSQWYGMGRQLLQKSKVYCDIISEIDKIFFNIAGYSLLDEILQPKSKSNIEKTKVAQPLIMALQIGLFEMYKSFGVLPKAALGHSIGEVAAAYCAGVIDLQQAVEVIYYRSKEQDKASNRGKMLAIGLTYKETQERIKNYKDKVCIGVVNSPNATVISGDKKVIKEIAQSLEEENIFNRTLSVNIAFHSHHMEVTKDNLLNNLKNLKPKQSKIDLYSSVTGKKENGLHFNNNYCYRNVRDEVLFYQAIKEMMQDDVDCFIEISPHPILSNAIEEVANSINRDDIEIITSLKRDVENFENKVIYEDNIFLLSIAKLFLLKLNISFETLFNNKSKYVKLPLYAWQHKEYWSESKEHEESRIGPPKYPFINFHIDSLSNQYHKIWDLNLNKKYQTFLKDHRIDGEVVVPGTAQVEIAYEVAKRTYGDRFSHIENINFPKALFLPNEDSKLPQARLEIISESGDYKIYSRLDENQEWVNNGVGQICNQKSSFKSSDIDLITLQKIIIKNKNEISPDEFYSKIKELGLNYGSNFRLIKEMWQNDSKKLARIELTDDHIFQQKYFNLMPNISDACLHVILTNPENGLYLPDIFGKYKIYTDIPITKTIWSYTNIKNSDKNYIYGESISFNERGEKILEVQDIRLKYLHNSNNLADIKDKGIYKFKWVNKAIASADPQSSQKDFILVFCDNCLSSTFVKSLEKANQNFFLIKKGAKYQEKGDLFTISNNFKDDLRCLFTSLKERKINFNKIVNLWNKDFFISDKDSSDSLSKKSLEILSQNLYLLKEIAGIEREMFIYQITQDADIVDDTKDNNINILQSSLYGMNRVFINEYPIHHIRMIDIEKMPDSRSCKLIFDEIFRQENKPSETEIAIRSYGRFARSLVKYDDGNRQSRTLSESKGSYFECNFENNKLSFTQDLYNQFREENLNEGEIVVEVEYYSLSSIDKISENFIKGFYGTVKKVGEKVKDFKNGDKVIGICKNCITSRLIIKNDLIIKKPPQLSDSDSAYLALPIFISRAKDISKIENIVKDIDNLDLARKIKLQLIGNYNYKTYNIADLEKDCSNVEEDSVIKVGGKISLLKTKNLYFKSNATYLITGGATGLGLVIAKWMFDRGAKNFALISRSGPKYESDKVTLSKMREMGANIEYEKIKGDISNYQDVKKSLEFITTNMPTLKGVIHSAGLLDDASYANMDIDRFLKIYNPKVLGAWNLHQETKDFNLDIFLTISSVSSIIGIAGQSNYSTANNFLNYLSLYRTLNGKKSNAACFGVLSSDFAGMSKITDGAEEMTYRTLGTVAISENEVKDKLESLLLSNESYLMLSPMNWDNYKNSNLNSENRFIFSNLLNNNEIKATIKSCDLKELILTAKDQKSKTVETLQELLSNILGITRNDVPVNKAITTIGLDSLMINQFRNKIKAELDINFPLMKLAKGPTINELSKTLLDMMSQNIKEQDKKRGLDVSGIENDPDIEVSEDKWIIRKKTEGKSKTKMFCLHPVGAGASIFSYFIFNPPKDVEVLAIQMPGRENRIDEDHYYNNMDNLIKDIAHQIISKIQGPTVLWGHSWGGVTLYEVIKYLRRNNYPEYRNIKKLIITGSIAPQLTLLWKDRKSIKETANRRNSIDRILSTVSYIDDKDYLRSIVPIMRKDMEMIMTYKYLQEDKLDIPILAFGAIEDEVVLISELQQWKEQTNSKFIIHRVHGDHWFLSRNKEFIIDKITDFIKMIND